MKVVINPGRRKGDCGHFTLLRERPLGPPLWIRFLILCGAIPLWLGICLPRFAG